MATKGLVVSVLWAFALCVCAISLALFVGATLEPSLSWAAVLERLMTQPPSPCACVYTGT